MREAGLAVSYQPRPNLRLLCVESQPSTVILLLCDDRVFWTFGLADHAIHADVGIDDQCVWTFVKCIDRANRNASHVLTIETGISDEEGHLPPQVSL